MNSSLRQMREMFGAQFERAGDGYIFRQDQKGPAFPLTAAEHAMFMARFGRQMILVMAATVGGTLALIGSGAYYIVVEERDPPEALLYLGLIGLLGICLAMMIWAWRAPTRALGGRTPVGRTISNEEFQRKHLAALGYGRLAIGGVFGLALPLLVSGDFDVLSGWGRLWLAVGGLVTLTCAVQAVRKWRSERRGP